MTDSKRGTKQVGDEGERLAASYLVTQGYQVRERNWRYSNVGELDIVAEEGGTLVFVEVRTRRGSGAAGLAEESVGPAKQRKLATLAYAYLDAHPADSECAWRIDVLAVQLVGSQPRFSLYRDAVGEVDE